MEAELHEKVHADLETRLSRVESRVFPPNAGTPAQQVNPPVVGGGQIGATGNAQPPADKAAEKPQVEEKPKTETPAPKK